MHSAAQYSLGKEPPTKLPSLTTTFDDVAVVVRYLVATLGPPSQTDIGTKVVLNSQWGACIWIG